MGEHAACMGKTRKKYLSFVDGKQSHGRPRRYRAKIKKKCRLRGSEQTQNRFQQYALVLVMLNLWGN
jgi:hypothetical protein